MGWEKQLTRQKLTGQKITWQKHNNSMKKKKDKS